MSREQRLNGNPLKRIKRAWDNLEDLHDKLEAVEEAYERVYQEKQDLIEQRKNELDRIAEALGIDNAWILTILADPDKEESSVDLLVKYILQEREKHAKP